jgi:hypothetical protein
LLTLKIPAIKKGVFMIQTVRLRPEAVIGGGRRTENQIVKIPHVWHI